MYVYSKYSYNIDFKNIKICLQFYQSCATDQNIKKVLYSVKKITNSFSILKNTLRVIFFDS